MNEEIIYNLLKTITGNGSLKALTRLGISFSQIATLTNQVIEWGYVSYEGDRIILSEIGKTVLTELEIEFKKTKKENWIEKDYKSVIPVLDKNVIFVPNQNELTF